MVAGPGAGKTEFLVRRAARLIDNGVHPDRLLALSFSRRSAADLRRRISDRVGTSHVPVQASTYHSFAIRLLEVHGSRIGWERMPTLLTSPEHVALVGELLAEEQPQDWPVPYRSVLSTATFASDVADFMMRCSERLLDPEAVEQLAHHRPDWRGIPGFFRRYLAELRERDRIDYGGILTSAIDVLADRETASEVSNQFHYVLADEYQDTSPAQVRLLEASTASHRNLTVAADPYQSIYSFRGADLESVAEFPDRFRSPEGTTATRIVLDTSFRVPSEIMQAALRVTSSGDLPGSAGPVKPARHRGSVEAYVFDQASAEAEWIASEVERLHLLERLSYSDIAVLVRSKRHLLPELSRALDRRRIPHDQPDQRLVDHPAVQIVFDITLAAELATAEGPIAAEHLDRAIRRILLGPLFGLSVSAERDLVRERRRTGVGWPEILQMVHGGPELAAFLSDPTWATTFPAADGFWSLWNELSGFAAIVNDPGATDARHALAAFAQALEQQRVRDEYVTLIDYRRMSSSEDFEATPLLRHRAAREDRLSLTTLHQAKGLEFEVVFIADATEGSFPDLRRGMSLLQPYALSGKHATDTASFLRFRLQEEMRLAYTAMTRARSRVVWTATAAGIDDQEHRPSRFMVPVASVASVEDLSTPAHADRPPITAREAQAALRRTLLSPDASAAERLAATSVLSHPPVAHWDARRFAGVPEPGRSDGVIASPLRLSPSQAQAYSDCPRRYVLEARISVTDRTSSSAAFGSLIHLTLERADRSAMQLGLARPTKELVEDHLALVWSEFADFGSPTLNDIWLTKARTLLDRLILEWPGDSGEAIAVERRLNLTLDGIQWTGRADRIERTTQGTLRVVDYKTGTRATSVKEAGKALQLGFYLLAARDDEELAASGEITGAEFWFPRSTLKDFRRRFDPVHLDDVRQQLVAIGRGIRDEEWRPRAGEWCKWCTVRGVCPLWPEGREGFVV